MDRRHLFALIPIAALLVAAAPRAVEQPVSRTVYVSVLAPDGVPVTDLGPADFAIKDGGKACGIVKAEILASAPMQVALIVDDNGTGFFRAGVAAFINKLQGHAQFAISQVNGQTQKLADFTTSMETLSAAVGRINARPASNEGGQLLEAIYEYSRELEKMEAARPVIVALTVGGNEQSTRDAKEALDQLQKSGAILHVAQVTGAGALRPQSTASKPSELLEGNMSLNEVLGDGPKQSGGRQAAVVATNGLVPQLQTVAEQMLRQYAITYSLPAGAKPSGRLSVSLNNKKGLTLVAPTRVPAR